MEEGPLFEFTSPAGDVSQSPRPLAASVVVHGLALLLLFALRFSSSVSSLPSTPQRVTLLAPVAAFPVRLPKAPTLQPHHERPQPPVAARLDLPAAPVVPPPVQAPPKIETIKPAPPVIVQTEIHRIEIPREPVAVPVVKSSGFTDTKSVAPVPAPKAVIRESGFQSADGSPTGPARGSLSAVGSFDTAHSAEGAPRSRNAIAQSTFSDATAFSGGVRGGPVTRGTFGDTTVDQLAAHKQTAAAVHFTPVEILSKPKPAYTAEARAKNIEGEVLIEMRFSASGEARVLHIVRGLGNGLDETAAAAARGIRFRPATRDGGAVDSAALVHIVFQLAQ